MKVNKYYPFAFIYFFLNAVGLPFGMLYTILLTPLFYLWIVLKGKKRVLFKFFIFSLPFVINHLISGVDLVSYVRSLLLFLTVYIFCYAFYTLITTYHGMEDIFEKILVTNFVLTIIALVFVFTSYRFLFWSNWSISIADFSIDDWPRLLMFTYEPSYYGTLLIPVFAFYFVKFILTQDRRNALNNMLMIIVPLVLSLSMGVIGSLMISISILFLINISRFLTSKKLLYSIFAVTLTVIFVFIALFVFFRENPFFVRILAIVAGTDGSANGRTFEAFRLAYIIADLKSIWWGIGPGQIKIIGDSIIKSFYHYPPEYGQVSIPSAFAETLALFGIVGVFFRLSIEIYLFYKTKVLNNYYQTLLFVYIFIYQFTGSYTSNIAEYVIWTLAFTNIFPQLDKGRTNNNSTLDFDYKNSVSKKFAPP